MSATRKNAARRKNPLSDDLEEGGFEARVQAAAHRLQAGQTEEEVEADLVLHHGVDGPMAMLIARAARVLLSEWEPRSERDTKPDMRAAKPAPKASQGRVLLGPTDDQVLQAIDSHTGAFVDMMPVDFLRLTTVDEDHVRKVQSEAHSIDKYEKHMAEGKCEIHPFLRIDTKSGQVVGHDGRHRAAAILSADPDAHMRVALIPVPLSKSASMADIPETIKGEYDPGFRIKIRNNVTVVDDNVQQGCASCGKPAKERKDLFEDTVLRRDKKGQIHLMNHPAKGWASYGIPYASEQDVLDEWNVTIDPWTTDKYGDVAKVRKVRMGNPVGKSRVDPVAPTPLATFRNDETGMETYVHSGQNGTFNVTMRDLDSGEWVPGARVGIKSLDEATRVASKWAGAGARRENPVARAPKAPPDAWSALARGR